MKKTVYAAMIASALALVSTVGANAGSPSFNCAYARLPAEVAICKSSLLGDLDSQMASEYFTFMNNSRVPNHVRRKVKGEQINWLRWRNQCGYAHNCLQGKYWNRITRLAWWNSQH